MEQFHRESDTFAQSSCHDLPSVSASATHDGKLACSSFRPKWVYDSASPTRDPYDTKSWKLFLSTLSASERLSLRLICDSESFQDFGSPTVNRVEERVKKSCLHVALHMGPVLGVPAPGRRSYTPLKMEGKQGCCGSRITSLFHEQITSNMLTYALTHQATAWH